MTFGHVGKPFLVYGQRTKASDDGRPLHAETGYLRVPSPDRVELVLAHPTGITKSRRERSSITGTTLELELTATAIGRTSSAKEVTALSRSIRVDGDELTYTLRLGAVGQPLQHHLAATLRRMTAMTGLGSIRQDPRPRRPRCRHGGRRRRPLRDRFRGRRADLAGRAALVSAGMHPAIQLCLRHNGRVVLNRAIGHGWGNGPDDPPDAEKITVTTETPFCVYSAAKAITTTACTCSSIAASSPSTTGSVITSQLHQSGKTALRFAT